MSLMTGCGDEKVKIQSRTEDHVKINGKGITYNPEEETDETVPVLFFLRTSVLQHKSTRFLPNSELSDSPRRNFMKDTVPRKA